MLAVPKLAPMFQRSVHFVGACVNYGQTHRGTKYAPRLILEKAGLLRSLDPLRVTYELLKNNPPLEHIYRTCRASKADITVMVGGDHCTSFASVLAANKKVPSLALLLVDAHADLNTMQSSPSGNPHGMWLRDLLMKDVLQYDDVVLFGTRDLDPHESEFIKQTGIKNISMNIIRRIGIENALAEAQWHLDRKSRGGYHLSFDIDALDPSVADATGTPVEGGLSYEEGLAICGFARSVWQDRFRSMDLVEVNPLLGQRPLQTINVARELITEALIGETEFDYNANFKN